MRLYRNIFLIILFFIASVAFAQLDGINIRYGINTFITTYDTSEYSTTLKVKSGNKTIYENTFMGRIDTVAEYDLDNDGTKEYVMDNFSGGAHCCTFLYAGKISNERFNFVDSIYWGNSFYSVEDLGKNNTFQIRGVNDMFAYYFTNYAESQFPLLIYGFENDKFINVTSRYPDLVESDIQMHLNTYGEITNNSPVDCPKIANEDTFNTTAGAVKAMLAPVVADYYTLGNVERGYAIVDSIYKCSDAESFKDTLKVVFKLK